VPHVLQTPKPKHTFWESCAAEADVQNDEHYHASPRRQQNFFHGKKKILAH
jgi:hypothetical protein